MQCLDLQTGQMVCIKVPPPQTHNNTPAWVFCMRRHANFEFRVTINRIQIIKNTKDFFDQ